ncbi:DUF4249 family protein [Carboxylicivirga sp. N1Y90]|uniref:DUF4249 family protein n=1 Tax=Carboxylicivirga fragile TaxID=3417571 RepID=UPI003D33392D|nr:DUF4249 domain-containing protein [Marinilabiliaceae bacterium N1Y90]
MIYKTYITILFASILLLSFTSCEEIIDIDLNSSNPSIVIDGDIQPKQNAQVRLSYTNDYFNKENPKYETNATITISNSEGISETLQHISDGLYTSQFMRGDVGQEYTIKVDLNNETFEGKSTMMTPTKILKLSQVKSGTPHQGDKESYGLEMQLTNNPEEDNYYLIKFFKNGALQEERYNAIPQDIFAQDEVIVYSPVLPSFEVGDEVIVKAYSIDESTYTYYSQLAEITSERPGGTTPYNPESNLGPNILGYFRAWSSDSQSITIQTME